MSESLDVLRWCGENYYYSKTTRKLVEMLIRCACARGRSHFVCMCETKAGAGVGRWRRVEAKGGEY